LVAPEQAVAFGRIAHYGLQTPLEHRFHFRQAARVAAAHHDHVRVFQQGVTEVVHQSDDAGVTGEFLTESR
jgi:hypothetical protein